MSDAEPLPKLPTNTLECRFCGKTSKNGTGRSAHERHCEKNPAWKPSKHHLEVQQRDATREANPENECPECAAEGKHRGFPNAGVLGSHRRAAHNVVGAATLNAKVPCTFPGCEWIGKTRSGMLIHYGRVHAGQLAQDAEPGVLVATNGHSSPAELRRNMRAQMQDRHDLITVVRTVFPNGIETHDEQQLDSHLGYIFQTASILESRR